MQTFLSEPTFEECASVLDSKRLNKQLLEGRQILKLLVYNDPKQAWFNHPAVRQWDGYIPALYIYLSFIYRQCKLRGIETTKNWNAITSLWASYDDPRKVVVPYWWSGNNKKRVLYTHRAKLYDKKPEHYSQYETYKLKAHVCCDRCNYFWPSHWRKNETI